MKRIGIFVILFGCFVSAASAQQATGLGTARHSQAPSAQVTEPPFPAIHGNGTANLVPVFIGPHSIGDSPISVYNGNIGIGTTNPIFPLHVFSNSSVPPPGQDRPITLFVENPASPPLTGAPTVGIESMASAQDGFVIGVHGVNNSPDGYGLFGNGGRGTGVLGQTDSTTGGYGVSGAAYGQTGPSAGVVGQAHSPDAVGGLFANFGGGSILVGLSGQTPSQVFRVDGTGTVFANGGYQTGGADFAESMAVGGDRTRYQPGDLLVIDHSGNRRLALSDQAYSTLVAGIYSTKPGLLASTHRIDDPDLTKEVPMAVVGIVPCKATAENGPINPGDLLVTSSTPGHAMKGTERDRMLGAVVGKALEPLREGKGVIQVLVTLQ